MKWNQLAGVELGVDLENPEFEGVEIDKYNFIRIMELYEEGESSLDDFGSGFEIRGDGIYLKLPTDRDWASLTDAERAVLARHPRGRPDKPVLAFPFTLRELKVFLDWAANVGHDVPIHEESLLEVIEAQTTWRAPIAEQGAQPQIKGTRHKSIPQQRIEVIQQWFDSQCKFTKDNLRTPKSESGKPWARQACWDWLSDQGYTSEGRLFGNSKKGGSAKSTAFAKAWDIFIKQY
ncbi:hypothetical protein NVV94_01375 [Pseudomonas sp. LS1212]|uniref:hypothetical protein n=1 Tax=Pseudomonas sp. LS1212 TaxID=2972478 RepID=UPI00215CA848|nr:hypothetical protein [Pseudomonas sp. LS1212]UVJ44294.1 hypothetical protein NVV94_01375 [Pseudomonas sp. LS1212]